MTVTAPTAAPTRTAPGLGISVQQACKTYPGMNRPALSRVSLDIAAGEFMTFLGPSGSGKSTLLSMIAGFEPISSGRIDIGGVDVSNVKPHKRNLGVVFQQYALFPHMTVSQNVAYPLQQRKVPKAEIARRVHETLDMVSLAHLADRHPKQLSGGQQQRVALARAIVYAPGALLLDEPLGALDKRLRDGLQRQIARMHAELGLTFIFVTHDQEEALTLSDRIAVFNDGGIEQVGTPHELYDKPNTLFVAQFLGESNVFRGQVGGGRKSLHCGLFEAALTPHQQDFLTGCEVGGLVVRPERLTVTGIDGHVPSGLIRAEAQLTDVVYVGNHNRMGLRFTDGTTGSAMQVAGKPLPAAPGDQVAVAWHPDDHSVVSLPDASA
ncbi:ABC transporter ATP-binding protein [Rhodococcus sp. NPDC057014]|uniref:ABC transporter ATP-binding protein n=1 Tax=Rhodococcus sp. NPDC057014 TaxID=3346000 RepID=UPI003644E68E